MNEPVKPVVATSIISLAHPWKALDPETKRFSTVNQTDIRGYLKSQWRITQMDLGGKKQKSCLVARLFKRSFPLREFRSKNVYFYWVIRKCAYQMSAESKLLFADSQSAHEAPGGNARRTLIMAKPAANSAPRGHPTARRGL